MGNHKTLNVNGFEWRKNTVKFDEIYIRNYDEDSDTEYILEVDVEYLEYIYHESHSDLPLFLKTKKSQKRV